MWRDWLHPIFIPHANHSRVGGNPQHPLGDALKSATAHGSPPPRGWLERVEMVRGSDTMWRRRCVACRRYTQVIVSFPS